MATRAIWLSAVAACSDPRSSDWAPAPAQAVAQCVYRNVHPEDEYTGHSTLHFDDRGRVIQVDGHHVDGNLIRLSTMFEYDDENRLVHESSAVGDVTYTYDAAGALAIGPSGEFRFDLDTAGRITRWHGPLDVAEDLQVSHVLAYDADGRVAHEMRASRTPSGSLARSDTRFTYDTEGRVATATKGDAVRTYVYTAIGNQLGIVEDVEHHDWTLQFDDQQRLRRINSSTAPPFASIEYSYGDGVFEETGMRQITATGACPLPHAALAPLVARIGWSASIVSPVFPQYLFADTFSF